MSAEIAQVHQNIQEIIDKFDIISKIQSIEEGDDVPTSVPVKFTVKADASITLEEGSTLGKSSDAPKSLSSGDTAKFSVTQGEELKYALTSGAFASTFKIVFEIDKSAPKLKLSDELESDDSPVGFETTKTEKKTEIEIETEIEVEKKWTKGKKVEKKTSNETKRSGKAGPYSFKYEKESENKQEDKESKSEIETETELSSKTVELEYVIY